jgi:hypothetical protein
MNQPVVVSLLTCSATVAVALVTNTAPPIETELVKTIPYPEVMNLSRVPTFNAQGMVPQTNIAGKSPRKSTQSKSVTRVAAAPITVDLVTSTVREATIKKYGDDCSSCRNLSPTVMVLGYSSDRAIGGLKQTMY